MKTSDQVKLAGYKNLKELSKKLGITTQTLRNWQKNKPEIFEAALKRSESDEKRH